MSVPSSPVESQKSSVTRTSSNPFFVHMKEPPKYDEAVKNIQHQKVGRFNSVPASSDLYRLLITFENCLVPDQAQHYVMPKRDPNIFNTDGVPERIFRNIFRTKNGIKAR